MYFQKMYFCKDAHFSRSTFCFLFTFFFFQRLQSWPQPDASTSKTKEKTVVLVAAILPRIPHLRAQTLSLAKMNTHSISHSNTTTNPRTGKLRHALRMTPPGWL